MSDREKPNAPLYAIFNPRELETFCRRFKLRPAELEPNFRGWFKRVVMTKHRFFLFPRDHEAAKDMKAELDLHEFFTRRRMPGLPRLVARVRDPAICRYEFGIIRPMRGVELGDVLLRLSPSRLTGVLVPLARLVASWHAVPLRRIRGILARARRRREPITIHNWGFQALLPGRAPAAARFIQRLIRSRAGRHGARLVGKEIRAKWTRTLAELARMQEVLIMADIHDEQILLRSRRDPRLVGVFDWGGTRIDHPVWDFNFGEWNEDIFRRGEWFLDLRRAMWEAYLRRRGLELSTPHGLHLFHTLNEFTWLLIRRRERRMPITGKSFAASLPIYARRLAAVTALLP